MFGCEHSRHQHIDILPMHFIFIEAEHFLQALTSFDNSAAVALISRYMNNYGLIREKDLIRLAIAACSTTMVGFVPERYFFRFVKEDLPCA